jgi:anti-anti-sigma regulatory factor
MAELAPFAVEVQRREHVAIVQPHGELDLFTVRTLRRLTFIDSNGLHLLVALDQRAARYGFLLTLLAPAAPVDRTIQLAGLDRVLPFVEASVRPGPGSQPVS